MCCYFKSLDIFLNKINVCADEKVWEAKWSGTLKTEILLYCQYTFLGFFFKWTRAKKNMHLKVCTCVFK